MLSLPDSVKDMRGTYFLKRCEQDIAFRAEFGDLSLVPDLEQLEPKNEIAPAELIDQSQQCENPVMIATGNQF